MDIDTYTVDMVDNYVIAALWSTTDDEGEPLDATYDEDDLAPETRAAAERVCRDFVELAVGDGLAPTLEGMGPEQAGHDLWLTREGHGAGFWDRGLGERGDRLTKWAKTFGSADWYVGDDGKIYGSD